MIKLIDLLENVEIKNINYYQQLLDSYDQRRLSIPSKQCYQKIIDSVKKRNNLATPKQFNLLQRLKTGDFNYGKK
jgi:hypothetical protein